MMIQFATRTYKSKSLPVSSERVVNAYAEREPPDAKTQVAVLGAPGLTLFGSCGVGPVRGMNVLNDTLYVVSGSSLYTLDLNGNATVLGTGISGSGPVSMENDGTHITIVNGVNGYVYSSTTGFVVITDTNFHAAQTVTFFDNYFVFPWSGTNKFFISNSLDPTTYSGTDFASKESHSDFIVSIVNQQENLLIFGEREIETWYDAGAVNFPFLRVDGATIERGCAASLTPLKEDNSVFFLGDDKIVYRLNGIQPVRVSDHGVEDAIQSYTTISDAFSFSFTFEGHKFVVLTFPSANASWVYDISTGFWHERESWDQNGNRFGRWRGNCSANCYNRVLIGDAYSGQVGYLDANAFTEFGNTMQAKYESPSLHSDRKRIFLSALELEFESGVGLTTGQGSNPQVMLEISRDGGRTWGSFQSWNALGQIGAYRTRLRWLRNGQARDLKLRVTISDPVRRNLVAARADLSMGI